MDAARAFGRRIPGWRPPPAPPRAALEGRLALLEPLDAARHAPALHDACAADPRVWDHLPYGLFADAAAYGAWAAASAAAAEPLFLCVSARATGRPLRAARLAAGHPAMRDVAAALGVADARCRRRGKAEAGAKLHWLSRRRVGAASPVDAPVAGERPPFPPSPD